VESPPLEEPSYPVASPPPEIVRTTRGDEVQLDQQRFGSMELEINGARLLDGEGHAVTEVVSGQAVQIDIDYVAIARLVAPIFYTRIERPDGLLCYDLNTEFSALSLSAIHGPGRITLHIERVDLNSGRYVIEVGCYAQGWAYCYDRRVSVCSLTVHGEGLTEAILNVPHRWEMHGDGAVGVAAVESGAGSSSA
jgi:lipopolysaccharide transport system ATP-binding protein